MPKIFTIWYFAEGVHYLCSRRSLVDYDHMISASVLVSMLMGSNEDFKLGFFGI